MPAAVTAGPFPDVLKQPFCGPPDIRPHSGISGTPAPRVEGINPSVSKSSCIREDPGLRHARGAFTQLQWREKLMLRFWISLALLCATPLAYGNASSNTNSAAGSRNKVTQSTPTI